VVDAFYFEKMMKKVQTLMSTIIEDLKIFSAFFELEQNSLLCSTLTGRLQSIR
jgi:hypothetical protein